MFRALRRGEACGQLLADLVLDTEDPGLDVTASITTVDWHPVHSVPKTPTSDATVTLDPDSVEIRRRLASRDADKASWGPDWHETGRRPGRPTGT